MKNSTGTEFRAHLQQHIDLEDDSTKEGFFRKIVFSHIMHSSEWREGADSKLGSLDSRQALVESDLSTIKTEFKEFRDGEIKELKDRLDKIEKKWLVVCGVGAAIMFIPYLPTLAKFLLTQAKP